MKKHQTKINNQRGIKKVRKNPKLAYGLYSGDIVIIMQCVSLSQSLLSDVFSSEIGFRIVKCRLFLFGCK